MSDHKNGASAKKTLVEEGTQFKGALSSNCPIEVRGRIEGEVSAPALSVSESGAVHGRIKVGELTSQGELAGELDADVVQLSGTIKDNTIIRAKSLEVKLSSPNGKLQVTFGECQLEVGSEEAQAERAAKLSERPGAKKTSQQPPPKTESVPPNGGPNGSTPS
jgi:cytoskeletal protein CcmA (bactofilin family)